MHRVASALAAALISTTLAGCGPKTVAGYSGAKPSKAERVVLFNYVMGQPAGMERWQAEKLSVFTIVEVDGKSLLVEPEQALGLTAGSHEIAFKTDLGELAGDVTHRVSFQAEPGVNYALTFVDVEHTCILAPSWRVGVVAVGKKPDIAGVSLQAVGSVAGVECNVIAGSELAELIAKNLSATSLLMSTVMLEPEENCSCEVVK